MYQNMNNDDLNRRYRNMLEIKSAKKSARKDFNKIGMGLLIFLLILNTLAIVVVAVTVIFSKGLLSNYDEFEFLQTVNLAANDLVTIPSMFFAGIAILSMMLIKHNDVIFFKVSKPKKNIFALICIAFIFFMLSNVLTEMLINNLSLIGINNDFSILLEDYYRGNMIDNLFYLVFVAVVPSFVEEYLFRGVILGALRKYGDGFAILISAIMFGIMHGNFVQIPFAFIGGLILGYITVYSGSIIPAMIIHFMNNSFSVISEIILEEQGEQISLIITLIVYSIFVALSIWGVFYLTKKDKNIFKLNASSDTILTFKDKVKCFIKTPTIMIYNIIMIIQAIFLIAFTTSQG